MGKDINSTSDRFDWPPGSPDHPHRAIVCSRRSSSLPTDALVDLVSGTFARRHCALTRCSEADRWDSRSTISPSPPNWWWSRHYLGCWCLTCSCRCSLKYITRRRRVRGVDGRDSLLVMAVAAVPGDVRWVLHRRYFCPSCSGSIRAVGLSRPLAVRVVHRTRPVLSGQYYFLILARSSVRW